MGEQAKGFYGQSAANQANNNANMDLLFSGAGLLGSYINPQQSKRPTTGSSGSGYRLTGDQQFGNGLDKDVYNTAGMPRQYWGR
jgi:hypothetical protein